MSAGAFLRTKYQSDSGTIYAIRVQPETVAANIGGANTAPAGAIDGEGSVKARGGSREIGIKARKVRVKFTGAVPDGYKPDTVLEIPILTPSVYQSIGTNATGTYLGQPVEVVGKTNESIR